VPVFKNMTSSSHEQKICEEASGLLSEALEVTGYFNLIDRGAFLENPESMGIKKENIQFKNWTVIGAEFLITGGVQVSGDQFIIELRTFDALKQTLVDGLGKRYVTSLKDNQLQKIIQRYCGEVVFQLFGERDILKSKIDLES
jgi:TolB protein